MKGGILAAFLLGEGIVIWRVVHNEKTLPAPGVLAGIGALFLGGALIAEWVPASEPLILAVFVGLDVAALLNVLPAGLGGQISAAEQSTATAEGQSGGKSKNLISNFQNALSQAAGG